MMKKFVVTIFGSSFPSAEDKQYQLAYEIGKCLGKNGYVVCNGGYGGIMEASARGANEEGGTAIGVVTDAFRRRPNRYSTKVIKTKTHLERLVKLVEMGDAYLVLPGITGTLAELSFVWEYMAKGLLRRKPILVFGDYWKPVIDTIQSECIRKNLTQTPDLITMVSSIEETMKIIEKHEKSETF